MYKRRNKLFGSAVDALSYLFWFLVILTVVVFIHELGHYLLARINGVRVQVFSIGFGKELFGFNDSNGTRWKISVLPFGGYVKMLGDADVASSTDDKVTSSLTQEERNFAFIFKNVYQRASIVVAGPIFNYLSAIIIITFLFAAFGKQYSDTVIGEVDPHGAASESGLISGDKVIAVNGQDVDSFERIRQIVLLEGVDTLNIEFERNGEVMNLDVVPQIKTFQDSHGNNVEIPIIGVMSTGIELRNIGMLEAFPEALREVYHINVGMLKGLAQIAFGKRGIDDLGGPVKIAQYSGDSAKAGLYGILWFIAVISINLGMVNLFPLPMLDGGHLLYYIVEIVTGKPVSVKFQNIAGKISMAMLLAMMIVITCNDIVSLLR